MAQFLVEAFVSHASASDVADGVRRIERSAERLTSGGISVRYVQSILVPADETCFHLFESRSIEAVEEIGRRAGLVFDRITEAVEPSHLSALGKEES